MELKDQIKEIILNNLELDWIPGSDWYCSSSSINEESVDKTVIKILELIKQNI